MSTAPVITTVVMLICAGWIPPYLCTPRRDLSLGTCINIWLLTPNKALNVFEDASHRGGVLTRNPEGCYVMLSLPTYLLFSGFVQVTRKIALSRAFDFISDGPHEATEFACQRYDGDIVWFSPTLHLLIALRQAQLRTPGNVTDGYG